MFHLALCRRYDLMGMPGTKFIKAGQGYVFVSYQRRLYISLTFNCDYMFNTALVCVCVCVCARARARVCANTYLCSMCVCAVVHCTHTPL